VTVDQNQQARDANVRQLITDWMIFILNQALGKASLGVNVQACAQAGTLQIVNAMGSTFNTIILSSATGASLDLSLANNLTVNTFVGGVKAAFGCAAKSTSTSVLSSISAWLLPYTGWFKWVNLFLSVKTPATESALTAYYWNLAQPVQICEANNQVVSCNQPLYGLGFLGSGQAVVSLDPSSGTVNSLYAFPGSFGEILSGGTLDPVGHRYFQIGNAGTSNAEQLYVIDLSGQTPTQVIPNVPIINNLSF
jgi:hypothetical protein